MDRNIQFAVETPGKVILHGEHSVVYGKTAVAASIDLKTTLKFTNIVDVVAPGIILDLPCLNCRYELFLQDLNELLLQPLPLIAEKEQASFNLNTPEKIDFNALLSIVKSYTFKKMSIATIPQENAVLSFLCLYMGMFSSVDLFVQSFEITVLSDLNIGSGMGSSTAYNISVAAAFLQYIRRCLLRHVDVPIRISKEEYKPFTYWVTDLTTFESRELDLISRWGHLGDRVMHGNPSGIDNAVCTYGSVIEFRKGPVNPEISIIPNPKYLKILLVNTNVSRSTKKLVNLVARRRDHFTSVVDPILQAMDSIALSAAESLRRMSQIAQSMELSESKALEENVVNEIVKLEELIDINQQLLEALGVSHESLEHICRIAKLEGMHGKLTGAGGGGYAFVLIPFTGYEEKLLGIKMSLDRHHFLAQEVNIGGPGVTLREIFQPGEDMVHKDSFISEIIPQDEHSFSHIIHPGIFKMPYKSRYSMKEKDEDEDEEKLDEWPWPFDLREVVRNMLESQIHKDLDCEEVVVPLRQICAASVPQAIPKWMSEIDYFRKQIAPIWRNTVAKSQLRDWRKPHREKHKKRKSSKKPFVDSSPNLLMDYSTPQPWPPHSGPPRGVSSIIVARKQHGDWSKVDESLRSQYFPHRVTPVASFVSSHEPERIPGDKPYYVPKQSLQRHKLFPHERSPVAWLLDKFPPHGDRQWTCDKNIEEEAKRQMDKLNLVHKRFLKQQRGGCEYLESLMSRASSMKVSESIFKDNRNNDSASEK